MHRGVVLFAMVNGKLPFNDTSVKNLLAAINKGITFQVLLTTRIISTCNKIVILTLITFYLKISAVPDTFWANVHCISLRDEKKRKEKRKKSLRNDSIISTLQPNVTEECRNLIYSMLIIDPLKRSSIADMLNHPWFGLPTPSPRGSPSPSPRDVRTLLTNSVSA